LHFGVFDLETQRSAAKVGCWNRADRMGISCGVLYDSNKDTFTAYLEDQIARLIEDLQKVDLIVGLAHRSAVVEKGLMESGSWCFATRNPQRVTRDTQLATRFP
jgi:hypothetical protein